jgi:uncharacterized DUF497 family protein
MVGMKRSGGRISKSTASISLPFTGSTGRFATRTTDDREDYSELREVAKSFIDAELYVLVFTEREDEFGELIWVISLRKARRRERRDYARETQGR